MRSIRSLNNSTFDELRTMDQKKKKYGVRTHNLNKIRIDDKQTIFMKLSALLAERGSYFKEIFRFNNLWIAYTAVLYRIMTSSTKVNKCDDIKIDLVTLCSCSEMWIEQAQVSYTSMRCRTTYPRSMRMISLHRHHDSEEMRTSLSTKYMKKKNWISPSFNSLDLTHTQQTILHKQCKTRNWRRKKNHSIK